MNRRDTVRRNKMFVGGGLLVVLVVTLGAVSIRSAAALRVTVTITARSPRRGGGYSTRIFPPTRSAVGSMPGLSCSSLATVVPSFVAIDPSVSPDWTMYVRR